MSSRIVYEQRNLALRKLSTISALGMRKGLRERAAFFRQDLKLFEVTVDEILFGLEWGFMRFE